MIISPSKEIKVNLFRLRTFSFFKKLNRARSHVVTNSTAVKILICKRKSIDFDASLERINPIHSLHINSVTGCSNNLDGGQWGWEWDETNACLNGHYTENQEVVIPSSTAVL